MHHILHIVTRPQPEWAESFTEQQSALPDTCVETVDLTAGDPDYAALLRKVFESDTLQVW